MNNSKHPHLPNKPSYHNNPDTGCQDCCIVLKTTHDLIRSDLFRLIKNNRNKFIDPAELDVWLNDLYNKLNLKSED